MTATNEGNGKTEDRKAAAPSCDMTTGNGYGNGALVRLAQQVERTKACAKDYVVQKAAYKAVGENGVLTIRLEDLGDFKPTSWFLKQADAKHGTPQDYAEWVRTTDPSLYAEMFNHGSQHRDGKTAMMRTLQAPGMQPIVRAYLGERFYPIDNYDVLYRAMPVLRDNKAKIIQAECSDAKMYVKAVLDKEYVVGKPYVQESGKIDARGLQVGDVLNRGLIIKNSEVGAGAFSVEPFTLRLSCMNGMVGAAVVRKVHMGRKQELGEVFSQHTRDLEAETLFSQMGDIIQATFDETQFEKWLAQMNIAKEAMVEKPIECFEYLRLEYKLPKEAKDELLSYFATDQLAGPTVWGVANAVTAYAKSQALDRQVELEAMANQVLTDKVLLEARY